jgi:hypothetical protein
VLCGARLQEQGVAATPQHVAEQRPFEKTQTKPNLTGELSAIAGERRHVLEPELGGAGVDAKELKHFVCDL